MAENKGNGQALPDALLRSPIGSFESRAAARMLLQDPHTPPSLIAEFCVPAVRDELDNRQGIPVVCDSQLASIANRELRRHKNESLEVFRQRVSDALPGLGTGLAILWPNGDRE